MANYYNISGINTGKERPVAPASFSAAADGAAAIDLTWSDAAADYDLLHIEWSLDETTWVYLVGIEKTVEAYKHEGLTASTQYFYRAHAIKRHKRSTYIDDDGTTTA